MSITTADTKVTGERQSANVAAIQGVYAAFGRGDVEDIASLVTPDADWSLGLDPSIPGAEHLLHLGRFEGPDGVRAYFAAVGASLAIDRFDIDWIVAAGDEVVALIHVGATLVSSGGHVDFEEIHRFRFAANGRIDRYRPHLDTATLIAAAISQS